MSRSGLNINIGNLGKGVAGRLKVAILALPLLLILGAVACGGDGTATPTPGPKLPTVQELKQDAEELFVAISAAAVAQDAAAFLELMPASVREICTSEQLQDSLLSDGFDFPVVEVMSVFVDLEDPNQALARVKLRVDPEEGSMEGLATALFTAFPFPMLREEGQWKFDLLSAMSGLLQSVAACPFAGESASGEAQATQRATEPALRAVQRAEPTEFPRLEPPPGVNMRESSASSGDGETSSSLILETGMTLEELLQYYRGQVLEPGSVVQQEEFTEESAVLTWTFRDEANHPGLGALFIAYVGDKLVQVRMWKVGPGLGGRFTVPGAPVPVVAPAAP